jgi:hypothetical protein
MPTKCMMEILADIIVGLQSPSFVRTYEGFSIIYILMGWPYCWVSLKHMFCKDLSFLAFFDFQFIDTFSYNRDERSFFRLNYSLSIFSCSSFALDVGERKCTMASQGRGAVRHLSFIVIRYSLFSLYFSLSVYSYLYLSPEQVHLCP